MDNKTGVRVDEELPGSSSIRSGSQTLDGEVLPSYGEMEADASTKPNTTEKNALGPTTSSPFDFPATTELPSYTAATKIKKPIAVPQTSPSSTANFLEAYPPSLLSYGIPEESWLPFLNTLSAFLSANISKQALHHASDVATSMAQHQKQYANSVKRSFRGMGNSARRFNPFGVLEGAIGITLGAATHIVSSVLTAPISVLKKPSTPRERALVYLATANKDWLHPRSLHALLLDSKELAVELDVNLIEFLRTARREESNGAIAQLKILERWISGCYLNTDSNSQNQGAESSSAAGKRPWKPQLQLGESSFWLVIVHQDHEQKPTSTDTSSK